MTLHTTTPTHVHHFIAPAAGTGLALSFRKATLADAPVLEAFHKAAQAQNPHALKPRDGKLEAFLQAGNTIYMAHQADGALKGMVMVQVSPANAEQQKGYHLERSDYKMPIGIIEGFVAEPRAGAGKPLLALAVQGAKEQGIATVFARVCQGSTSEKRFMTQGFESTQQAYDGKNIMWLEVKN